LYNSTDGIASNWIKAQQQGHTNARAHNERALLGTSARSEALLAAAVRDRLVTLPLNYEIP
jgi:hypothetical protein